MSDFRLCFRILGRLTYSQVAITRNRSSPCHRRLSTLPTFKLERYFAKYEHLPNIHHLCASDTQSISVQEAFCDYADPNLRELWSQMDLAYTEVKGHPLLLQELANMYNISSSSPPLDPKLHLQELAPQEGILLGSLAMDFNASSRLLVMSPGYQSLHQIATELGAKVSHWTPRYDHKTGGTQFHVDDLRQLASSSSDPIKAVIVNFPHNPTGCLPSTTEWQEIIDIAKENDAYLFADEMYHGLEDHESKRLVPAVMAYPEKGISLSGLSKTYGMPGARIGWIACHDEEYMETIAGLRDWTTICSSAPSQLLGILALRARERLQERARGYVSIGRNAVANVLQDDDVKGVLCWGENGPSAGPMGWIQVNEGVSASEYCDVLVKESGIMLLPSSVYDYGGDRHFRVGFGREETPSIVKKWHATLKDRYHPATRILHGYVQDFTQFIRKTTDDMTKDCIKKRDNHECTTCIHDDIC